MISYGEALFSYYSGLFFVGQTLLLFIIFTKSNAKQKIEWNGGSGGIACAYQQKHEKIHILFSDNTSSGIPVSIDLIK